MGEEEHCLAAKWIRAEVLGKCALSNDEDLDEALEKVTGEEVAQGFLLGPYTLDLALHRARQGLTLARR